MISANGQNIQHLFFRTLLSQLGNFCLVEAQLHFELENQAFCSQFGGQADYPKI